MPNPQWHAFKMIRYDDDIVDVFVLCENIHPEKVEANDFVLVISKRGDNIFSGLKMLPRNERLSDRITAIYHDDKVYLEIGDKNQDGEYISRNVGFLVKDSLKSDVSTRATDCWEEVSFHMTAIVFEREGDGYSGGGVFAEDRKLVCSGSGGGGGVGVPGPAAGAGGIPSYSSPFDSGGGGSSGGGFSG